MPTASGHLTNGIESTLQVCEGGPPLLSPAEEGTRTLQYIGGKMRRILRAVCTSPCLLVLLVVSLLLGQAPTAQGADTPCTAVRALQSGACMPYTQGDQTYVLCHGPFSL